jgi:DNA-binding NtrC family response regulator
VNGIAENQLNVRTIGIAGEDYIADIKEGKLSRELISSLNIKTIHILPLREHAEDIPDYIKYYVDELVDTQHLVFRRFSVAAQNRLRNFPWPGNHIELKNIVQRLLINGLSEDVTLDEVESELQKEENQGENFIQKDLLSLPLREAREQFERAYLQQQLILCDGKVGKLAKRVGVERTHLYRKLKSLEINFNKKEV